MNRLWRASILLLTFCFLLLLVSCEQGKDSFDCQREIIDIEHNGEVLVYGCPDICTDNVPLVSIDRISETSLNGDAERSYHAVIIWNPDGLLTLSDEEILLLKRYVDDKQYDLIYYGISQFDTLVRLGLNDQFEPGETGLFYEGYGHDHGMAYLDGVTVVYDSHNLRDCFNDLLITISCSLAS